MLKRLICCAFVVMRSVMMTYGQLVPIQNVQSPEIANLGLYGQIPVSLYTGTPDISIPIYELKAGNYTLPISISYHLASVQPNRQYGVLGMGWNLMAGGYISRIANFLYDEKKNKNGEEYGYYYHHDKMLSVKENGENFHELVKNSIENENNSVYDICADDFYFNFCGYSGHFFLSPDGSWKVVSEHNIKVEFDPNNGGFIESKKLDQVYYVNCKSFRRINIRHWRNRGQNNCYFNKFTLLTPDGCRYEFGGIHATDYSISYYNPDNSDLIPTTWRLAKIVTPDKRVIQFNYKKDFPQGAPIQCDIRYAPSRCYGSYVKETQRGWDGMTGYLLFPSVLESITAENEKVIFDVAPDPRYIHMFEKNRCRMFYRNTNHNINNPYGDPYNSDNQYTAFFNANTYTSNKTIGEQIRDSLTSYYLKRIVVDTGFDEDSLLINFSYLDRKRKMLSKVIFNGKAVDESYTSKTYSFEYNEPEKMPDDFVFPATDSWGYYKGGEISLSLIPTFELSQPNILYAKAGVLKSIIYPTGGKTIFDYELNEYSKSIDLYDRKLIVDDGYIRTAGGLRVSKIQSIDSDGSVICTKKYYYTSTKNGTKSSGVLSEIPCFETNYNLGNKGMKVSSAGGFWPYTLNDNSPIVGYSTVYEELFDNKNCSLGYVKYCFSNFDDDIYGHNHLDDNRLHTSFIGGNAINYHYTSRSIERGKLLSQQYFDESEKLKKSIYYRYKTTLGEDFLTASQIVVNIDPQLGDYYAFGWLNRVYTYNYLQESVTDTIFVDGSGNGYQTRKEYEYNENNLPVSISERCSDGSTMTTSYLYSTDKPELSWLVDKHNLSAVIERKSTYRSKTKTEKYDYSSTPDTNVPYLRKKSTSYDGTDFKTDYEAVLVDKYGNPVEIVENGKKSLLYWCLNGQLIHGRIENFSNEQAKEIGMEDAVNYSNNGLFCMEVFWNRFYKLPSSAHMYVYNYQPRRLIESIIEPTGFTTFYKFDGLERLREIYHYDFHGDKSDFSERFVKRLMHVYDYHYIDNHQIDEE